MGPMSVADYFSSCLSDPEYGYYQTRDPFGTRGDFTTAPEISQLFGEMIGIFLALCWQAHGKPNNVRLIEIGPGRGTLMADVQRTLAGVAPDLASSATGHLVETSPQLSELQRQTLNDAPFENHWHTDIDETPRGFSLLFSNELFDAIPIRQFINTDNGFRERTVALDDNSNLVFQAGTASLAPGDTPAAAKPGDIVEVAPAREALMSRIAARLAADGGCALTVDYGFIGGGIGDTLQAVRDHRYVDVFEAPGESDLTSHVDFTALARAAAAGNVEVWPILTQSRFLLELGLLERAGALGAEKGPARQQQIGEAVNRLAGDGQGQMGSLFKVLGLSSPAIAVPPFARIDHKSASDVSIINKPGD
nr:class I SAM-dependent methyltransferase [Hoeflea prorocentri]